MADPTKQRPAHNFIDRVGRQYGRLAVVERAPSRGNRTLWRCRCECGALVEVEAGKLASGHTQGCGCKNPGRRTYAVPGARFGKLTVITDAEPKGNKSQWRCLCDCGTECVKPAIGLRTGGVKSCGCGRRSRGGLTKHPQFATMYRRWRHMILRCTDPTDRHYADWGGRGITICDRWADPTTGLHAFVADMGIPPGPSYTLDRRDNDGPYSPENCRWATPTQQTRNRRSLPRVRLDLLIAACAEVGVPAEQVREALALVAARSRRK